MSWFRLPSSVLAMMLTLLLGGVAYAGPKLVVLDLELTGDLGGPEFEQEHDQRLKTQSAELRRALAATNRFEILDNAPAAEIITRIQSQHAHVFDCNGCDLEVGKKLGADLIMVAYVDRVSGLILSLTYELHSVATGQIAARNSYDFRGDNDTAWKHAIDYAVRNLPAELNLH